MIPFLCSWRAPSGWPWTFPLFLAPTDIPEMSSVSHRTGWVRSLILRGIASGPSQSTCVRSHASALPCTIKDHPTQMQHHIPAPPALIWKLLEQGESWLLLWSTHVWNHINTVQPDTFNSRNKSIKTEHFIWFFQLYPERIQSIYCFLSLALLGSLLASHIESPCILIIYFTGIWSICISKG